MENPVAVSFFDLTRLERPAGTPRSPKHQLARGDDGVGFGEVWVEHLGGERAAVRHVRQTFKPASQRAGVQHTDLQKMETRPHQVPGRSEVLGAKLGLRLLVQRHAEAGKDGLPFDLWKAMAAGLEVESLWHRRNRMQSIVASTNVLRARKLTMTGAVEVAAHWSKTSKAGVWNTLRTGVGADLHIAHATSPWFEAGYEDAVAVELVRLFRAGEATQRHRWDVFNLFEGFYLRKVRPSIYAFLALDHALAVFDSREIPLGDIVRRDAFMVLARFLANEPEPEALTMEQLVDSLPREHEDIGPSTLWRWTRGTGRPIFEAALRLLQARASRTPIGDRTAK